MREKIKRDFAGFFLLKEKFIVTSHGDNCRYKGNNTNRTHNLGLRDHQISATKESLKLR